MFPVPHTLEWIATIELCARFDWTDNGRIDFADLVPSFSHR